MTRTRVILFALLIGSMPVATAASAQARAPVSSQAAPALALIAALADEQQSRERIRERDRDDDDRDRFEDRFRDRDRIQDRDDRRGSDRSANPGDAARAVASGRDGRMLGIRPAGEGYVVRWEYPGGRVSDIRVDGRTGRVSGD